MLQQVLAAMRQRARGDFRRNANAIADNALMWSGVLAESFRDLVAENMRLRQQVDMLIEDNHRLRKMVGEELPKEPR